MLDGGYRLGVGEDLEQVGELEDTFLGIVLVLGIGGGLLWSAAFLRRVDMITRTVDAIISGDLSPRIGAPAPETTSTTCPPTSTPCSIASPD
jgi:hypothetical protein